MTRQLTKRELELSDANEKIAMLKERIDEAERNAERFAAERDKARRELEAMREVCSKMEIEKEKLTAEVNEYAEIRRELERDNDKLRNELMQVSRARIKYPNCHHLNDQIKYPNCHHLNDRIKYSNCHYFSLRNNING